MTWAKLIGAIFFVTGIALLVTGLVLVRWENWVPVAVSLPLKAGNHAQASFRSEFSARHYIYLTVRDTADWKRTKCLLGVELESGLCQNTPSVVDVSWTASSAASLLGHGDSHEWLGTRGILGRMIGMFEVEKGTPCTFSITVNRDGSELNALDPKVTVEVDDRIFEQYIMYAAILKLFGATGIVLGLIMLTLAFLKHPGKKLL
jgi:hypothetical protein